MPYGSNLSVLLATTLPDSGFVQVAIEPEALSFKQVVHLQKVLALLVEILEHDAVEAALLGEVEP